ncbi:TPA: chloride channel protein [Streptococcus agalactiae]|nr:chloride channel protein [Streptococcus agalactiae]
MVSRLYYAVKFMIAVLFMTVMAGVGAILMHYVLMFTEWLAFGDSRENTLSLLNSVTPIKRVLSLTLVSFLASLSWYYLQIKPKQITSIKQQVVFKDSSVKKSPYWLHIGHAFLQLIYVGAGGPIGKEGAPREFGAINAGKISDLLALKVLDKRLLIISGAASIAQLVISTAPLYHISKMSLNSQLLAFMFLIVLCVTPIAISFRYLNQKVTERRIKNIKILLSLPVVSLIVSVLSIVYPQILGNGNALVQEVFKGTTVSLITILVVLKMIATLSTLYAGAYGGILTPSFSIGACLGFLLASISIPLLPHISIVTSMLVGAAIFLAITMRAPLTAVGLVISFTGQSVITIVPLTIAVLFATAYDYFIRKMRSLYVNPY